ncbi:MAG: cyclodeaminase/cyclohydrolase family protein [Chloroflexi bacterium]|nr:cyclodeaminase/cyclohydrolase family protein [Chloroflexota bacterium]
MNLTRLPITEFLERLADGGAVPGGGAAAGLAGAQAAALISMVCRLTVGRKKYAAVETEMREALSRAEMLRAQLTGLTDRDASAFDGVAAAYKMPKTTAEEKARRSAAIQAGLKQATLVPLETLEACVEVLELSEIVIEQGNPNVVSDAAAGVLLGHAGMMTAAVNVQINLNSIKDERFVAEQRQAMEALLKRGHEARKRAWSVAAQRLGMQQELI